MTLTPATLLLLALIVGLLVYDLATLRRYRRLLILEVCAFAVGGMFVLLPDLTTRLAHAVGIGRGVDFVLYPLVIWLVRESFVARRRRLEDEERMTRLVRALAERGASDLGAAPQPGSILGSLAPPPPSDKTVQS